MTSLFLHISDTALCEALLEQIRAAKLGDAKLVDSASAWLKQSVQTSECPDIIVIDDADCAALASYQDAETKPVIMVLGNAKDDDGVSETFGKPFRLGHFISRLRYYVETAPLLRSRVIRFGRYQLEPKNRRVLIDGMAEPVKLTEKETALLVFLSQAEAAVSRREILASVWGYDERIDTHTLETHIYQLRRKLDVDGSDWLIVEAGCYRLYAGREP